MSIEEKMKGVLGEQAFHIAMLLHQIDELQKRITELREASNSQSAPQPVRHANGGGEDHAR